MPPICLICPIWLILTKKTQNLLSKFGTFKIIYYLCSRNNSRWGYEGGYVPQLSSVKVIADIFYKSVCFIWGFFQSSTFWNFIPRIMRNAHAYAWAFCIYWMKWEWMPERTNSSWLTLFCVLMWKQIKQYNQLKQHNNEKTILFMLDLPLGNVSYGATRCCYGV